MITWAFPLAFLLLVPVVARVFVRAGPHRVRVARADRPAGWTARRVLAPLPNALGLLGLALTVVALARPRVTHHDRVVEQPGLDILLAIDTSGSMRGTDLVSGSEGVSRLEVAKGVMADFVAARPDDRVGLVVFGEDAFTLVPLTTDHLAMAEVLDTVQIGVAGSRGTAVGDAIAVAARRLEQVEARSRLVVLLTDGQSNAGRFSPIEAAQLAAAVGTRVYTIGVGGGGAGLGDGLDEVTLTRVAQLTGAKYQRAASRQGLRDVFQSIDQLEPSPAKVRELSWYDERFGRWLVPGLLAVVAQVVLAATALRRAP